MHYLYVLKSKQDGELYVGSTTDLRRRLIEHNKGLVAFTKARRPLVLVYYEAYASLEDARLRESRLKQRGQARVQLMYRINKSLQVES